METRSTTRRFDEMGEGLLADAWRTIHVGAVWAFELLAGVVAHALGASAVPQGPRERVEMAERRTAPAAPAAVELEPGPPMTLRELGLPRSIADELEAAFLAMGAVEGGLVAGYTFLGPDGVRHAVRLGPANGPASPTGAGPALAA
jgi:hypothetical protein